MIRIRDLSFKYQGGGGFALQNVGLDIAKGDFVGVIGASGAGKSTLIYAIGGVVPHHYTGDFYGSVCVKGQDTVETRPDELALTVGSVFQDIESQLTAMTVEDEVIFGLENYGTPRELVAQRLVQALEMTGIENLRHRALDTLSGGQKQKVAIAAILALQPEILVLDEPTGELDPRSSRQIFELLRKLNRDYGTTIVVVEQKIMLLCEFAGRLVVMEKGGVAYDGGVREVLAHSEALRRMGINVPRVVSLAEELRNRGLYGGESPLNVDEAEQMARRVMGA